MVVLEEKLGISDSSSGDHECQYKINGHVSSSQDILVWNIVVGQPINITISKETRDQPPFVPLTCL